MKPGDVVLAQLRQADGMVKTRPALVLGEMPPFADFLLCGVSTQLRHEVAGFDEVMNPTHDNFNGSGLVAASLIRLGFLAVLPRREVLGSIGSISPERLQRMVQRLCERLGERS